jgi:phenylacetate-coenzyme A ligase PaaK-like adenylate-forming protein
MISFAQLQDSVAFATKRSSRSSFYRSLYCVPHHTTLLAITTIRDWEELPYIAKEHLLNTPLSDRLFVERTELDSIYVSSGTTGRPPLFSPRNQLGGFEYRTAFHDFQKPIISSITYQHKNEYFLESLGRHPRVLALDPSNVVASVRMAKRIGADCISTQASLLPLIGEVVRQENMGASIRLIEACRDPFSHALYEYVHAIFPNATIISHYGASEVECSPIGVICRPIDGSEPLEIFHANSNIYLELIDPQTLRVLEPKEGTVGELVVTAFSPESPAFPLLRYRIGDKVQIHSTRCPKHKTWSFVLLGRSEEDFIKIPGGVLRTTEIKRVLSHLHLDSHSTFHMYYAEVTVDGRPLLRVTLFIESKHQIDFKKIAEDVAQEMHVGPSTTYADGVKKHMYLPLICRSLNNTNLPKEHANKIIQDTDSYNV